MNGTSNNLLLAFLLIVAGVAVVLSQPAPATVTCPVPAGYYSVHPVSALPTLDNTWVRSFGSAHLNVFAGSPATSSQPTGFPVNFVTSPTSTVDLVLGTYGGDTAPYPAPGFLRYEGWPGQPLYDQVMVTVTPDCHRHELLGFNNLFNLGRDGFGYVNPPYKAEGAVDWDAALTPHTASSDPYHGTSAGITASRVPLEPLIGLEREVAAGFIGHALHWYGLNCNGRFVWPARGQDCTGQATVPDPAAPPYGAWFRLDPAYPEANLSPAAATVVHALKTYGMILGDGGGEQAGIALESMPELTPTVLGQLQAIPLGAFAAVDTSSLPANPGAGINDPTYWLTR